MEKPKTRAWCKAECKRRSAHELAARIALLAPAEEFDNNYAPAEALARIRRHADPRQTGPESHTVRGILCGACAGWRIAPTSQEFYEAVQAEKPTPRQLSIVGAVAIESSWTELISSHLERAFTWQQVVHSLQARGWCPPERAHEINRFRKRHRTGV
jgi:hypothetical protein